MEKQRKSKQRQLILDAVTGRCDHPTADQIYLEVREKDEKISRGTVYRNLGVLSENGQISNVKIAAADRYDSRLDKHYHLICTCCGKVFDAPVPYHAEYDIQVEQTTGFQVRRHRTIFEGLCAECSKKTSRGDES